MLLFGTCHRIFRGNPWRPRTYGGCCAYQLFELYTLNGRVLYQRYKKNRPLTGRYTLGDRAISTTQNRCVLLNAQGGLIFYRLLETLPQIFHRIALTLVINVQVPYTEHTRRIHQGASQSASLGFLIPALKN